MFWEPSSPGRWGEERARERPSRVPFPIRGAGARAACLCPGRGALRGAGDSAAGHPPAPPHAASSQEASWGICWDVLLIFLPVFMLLGPDLPKEPRAGARQRYFLLSTASWKPAPSKVPERSVLTQHLTGEGQRVLQGGTSSVPASPGLAGMCALGALHHLAVVGLHGEHCAVSSAPSFL